MKILILERDKMVREVLVDMLKNLKDITVHAAGEEEFAKVPDLVIVLEPDLIMMNWAGFEREVLEEILEFAPTRPGLHGLVRVRKLALWVISGYSPEELHKKAPEADLILNKGFLSKEVLRALVARQAELKIK